LQSAFQKQLKGLANDFYKIYQKPLILTDTLRTHAEQAQAHREKPTLALPAMHPNAMHPRGLAVDVDQKQAGMITSEMLAKNGLHLPALSKGEDWHIEPKITQGRVFSSSSHGSSAPATSQGVAPAELLKRLTQKTSKSELQSALSESTSPLSQQDLTEQGAPSERRRLLQAAMEVEAIFMEQLLQQMRRTMVEPLSPTQKKLQGYLSIADQQLARSLAAGGGLGLAERIVEDLASIKSQPHTENSHAGNPVHPGKNGASTRNTLI
jgi:peptidoglycan hydrolase FlgJ